MAESKTSNSFWLMIGGAMVMCYGGYYYLSHRQKASPLSLLKTRSVAQEIKHQLLMILTNMFHTIKNSFKNKSASPQELQEYFRKEIIVIYKEKEQQILEKHETTAEEYGAGLAHHGNDVKIKANIAEIMDIMERVVKGESPNYHVNQAVFLRYSPTDLKNIYIDLALFVLNTLAHKIKENSINNPLFDPLEQTCIQQTINSLKLYARKADFLREKGFDDEWGCPNEVLFKAIESVKKEKKHFAEDMLKVEKTYEELTDKVKKSALTIQDGDLRVEFHNKLAVPPPKEVNIRNLSQKPVEDIHLPPLQRHLSAQPTQPRPKPKPINDDDDLAEMMLAELKDRTLNKPTQAVKPIPVLPKVEEHKEEEEKPAQSKPEQHQEYKEKEKEEKPVLYKPQQHKEEQEKPVQSKASQHKEEEEKPVQSKVEEHKEEEKAVQSKAQQHKKEEKKLTPVLHQVEEHKEEEKPVQSKVEEHKEEEEKPVQSKVEVKIQQSLSLEHHQKHEQNHEEKHQRKSNQGFFQMNENYQSEGDQDDGQQIDKKEEQSQRVQRKEVKQEGSVVEQGKKIQKEEALAAEQSVDVKEDEESKDKEQGESAKETHDDKIEEEQNVKAASKKSESEQGDKADESD